jgi:hypothetical protein
LAVIIGGIDQLHFDDSEMDQFSGCGDVAQNPIDKMPAAFAPCEQPQFFSPPLARIQGRSTLTTVQENSISPVPFGDGKEAIYGMAVA